MLEALAGKYDVWGLEPDDSVRRRSRSAIRDHVLPGDTRDLAMLKGRQYDIVMLLDVIEHIENDVEALRAAASAIAPGGRLLITVPANPHLWSAHDERNGHFRRYTSESLSAALAEAGFTPALLTYFNSRLYPLVRLHRSLSNARTDRELELPSAAMNQLLRRVFAGERHWLRRGYRRGLSLLAVASIP
jgi:SAM-dependent methyltransferase